MEVLRKALETLYYRFDVVGEDAEDPDIIAAGEALEATKL